MMALQRVTTVLLFVLVGGVAWASGDSQPMFARCTIEPDPNYCATEAIRDICGDTTSREAFDCVGEQWDRYNEQARACVRKHLAQPELGDGTWRYRDYPKSGLAGFHYVIAGGSFESYFEIRFLSRFFTELHPVRISLSVEGKSDGRGIPMRIDGISRLLPSDRDEHGAVIDALIAAKSVEYQYEHYETEEIETARLDVRRLGEFYRALRAAYDDCGLFRAPAPEPNDDKP